MFAFNFITRYIKATYESNYELANYLLSNYRNNIIMMNRTYLGEFEEIVLLGVAVMQGQAYGVVLMHEIIEQTGRSGATAERGGRRKRLYTVTAYGQRTLQQIQEVRDNFWSKLMNPIKPVIGL